MAFPISNTVRMGGKDTPGYARPRKASDPRTWDVRKGYGFSGAYAIYTGDDLSKFDVDVVLWLPDQFEEWKDFAKVLVKPTAATRTKSIGIYHPLLRVPPLDIKAVQVLDVSQFEPGPDMLFMCTISLLVYRPPKPVLARPNASIPSASSPTPTAKDAADAQIQALVGEVKGLL